MPSADVFHSAAFILARNVVVLVAVVFWLALGLWVYRDARRRVRNPFLVAIATLLGLAPPYLGALVYLLFRPAETLDDRRARNAELRALEGALARARPTCPSCAAPVDPDFVVCPVCTLQLREPCVSCDAPLEPHWQVCPYCATVIGGVGEDVDAALAAEARLLAWQNGAGMTVEPRAAQGL